MKILLDTNAYVGCKLNLEQVVSMITNAEHIYFSPLVLGELMFGFRNGSRFREDMEDLNIGIFDFRLPSRDRSLKVSF